MFQTFKYQATGDDSIRLAELEKLLTEEEIKNRITDAFNKTFTKKEINDIYTFLMSSAFDKVMDFNFYDGQFKEIDEELDLIEQNLIKSDDQNKEEFKFIPTDRENGFYLTTNYYDGIDYSDIQLEEEPSLSILDIAEVTKAYDKNGSPYISIMFTKEGAQKFAVLTNDNIGKPLAIVVDKLIISIPMINAAIIGGKASISGNFTEDEINKIIEELQPD